MPMEPVIFAKGNIPSCIGRRRRTRRSAGSRAGRRFGRCPRGTFTAEYARDVYGVVLDGTPFDIDRAETDRHRAELRNSAADAEHPAYLRYFHDALGIHEFRLMGEREMES